MKIKLGTIYIYITKYRMKRRDKLDDKRRNKRGILNRAKKRIYKQTGGVCSCCGKTFPIDALNIHHIVPVAVNPKLIAKESNLKLMCDACHVELHRKKGVNEYSVGSP